MGITSLGIFGYLSGAYQVNASKFTGIESQVVLIEQQKAGLDTEVKQIKERIETLNKSRVSQEQRLPSLSRQAAAPIYADIARAGTEIKDLTTRTQTLQSLRFEKDNEVLKLKSETAKAHDIGTFKFIAQQFNKPLDTVVTWFICVLITVFDPLAVALILAFNTVTSNHQPKKKVIIEVEEVEIEEEKEPEIVEEVIEEVEIQKIQSEPIVEHNANRKWRD
jgi:hypothetical protein